MTQKEVKKLPNGVYFVWWKEGGVSLASIGCTKDGKRWLAPSNWINVPSVLYWKQVLKVNIIHTDKQLRG